MQSPMKFDGINEVLFDEVYDELLARYSETQEFISPCGASKPKAPKGPAKPKAAPKASTPPKPPTKPTASKGAQGGPKKKKPCPPKATSRMSGEGDSFSETLDYMLCQRPDGTYYGTAGVCRKGVETTRDETVAAIEKAAGKKLTDEQKAKLGKLSDDDLAKAAEKIADKESFVRKAAGGDELSDKEVAKRVADLNAFEQKYGEEGMESLGRSVASLTETSSNDYVYKKTPREEEIEALQNDKGRAEKLVKGFDNASSLQKGGENAAISFRNVSDDEVDLAWSLSSKGMQSSFKAAGTVPNKDAWKGLDEKGENTYGSNSTERGKALMKRWMEQDGKDGYSGRPLTLNNADLEHIVPFSKAGRDAEQPSNWLWISRGLNTSKGNKDMTEFVSGVRKLDAQAEGKKHAAAVTKATQAGGKADLKAQGKDSGFMSKLEVAQNRQEMVDVFAKAGLTRYIAGPLGSQKIPGQPEADKIKFVDKTGPNRGQVKQLLQTKANWTEGKGKSGSMTASEWIARNYPGMSPAQKAKFKNLYNQARTETDTAKAAGQKATGGTFAQRLADLTAEAFSGEQYE